MLGTLAVEDVHPMLLPVPGRRQQDLQLIVLCAVGFPQFDELVALVWVLR